MNCNMDGVVRKILFVSLSIYFLIKLYQSVIKVESKVSIMIWFIAISYNCFKHIFTNDNYNIFIWIYYFPSIYSYKIFLKFKMIGCTSSVESDKRIKYPSISICQSRTDKMRDARYNYNGVNLPSVNSTIDLGEFLVGVMYFNGTRWHKKIMNMIDVLKCMKLIFQ